MVLLYLALWLFEGALRRWVLPQFSNPLLLVRDPVALGIYTAAVYSRRFPRNPFIIGVGILSILEIGFATLGHADWLVAAYGVRCDFLHVPMIFIIGSVFTKERLVGFCRIAVLLSIPYTVLLIVQFYSPQSSFINLGLAGDLGGAGFSGALDKFRPPGTFSFITGPALLFPLFAACLYATWSKRWFPLYLCAASALSIAIAIPISISRSLFIGVLIVFATAVALQLVKGNLRLRSEYIFLLITAILLAPFGWQLPFIQDGISAFAARWTDSTTDSGGVQEAIFKRVFDETIGILLDPNLPLFGAGTGYSTNVGQKQLTGELGFGKSEGEIGRLIFDNGLVLGPLLVLFRLLLAMWVGIVATSAFLKGNSIGLVFFSAACLPMILGQWGQPTTQGAATIAAGLTLAASLFHRSKPSIAVE